MAAVTLDDEPRLAWPTRFFDERHSSPAAGTGQYCCEAGLNHSPEEARSNPKREVGTCCCLSHTYLSRKVEEEAGCTYILPTK